jgi:hypothetical protein
MRGRRAAEEYRSLRRTANYMDGKTTGAVIQVTGVAETYWNWGAGRESTVGSGKDAAERLERRSRRAPKAIEKSRKVRN